MLFRSPPSVENEPTVQSAPSPPGMTSWKIAWSPVAAMRFDDSLYRTFGSELVGLGRAREVQLSASTYFRRSSESAVLPGALIGSFALTL